MSIKTKTLVPTSIELFKVFITNYIKERWLLWVFFLLLISWNIYTLLNGSQDYLPLIVIIGILLLIFMSYVRQFYANKTMLVHQHYELKDDALFIYKKRGSNEVLPINKIKKAVKASSYFLIFVSKNKFYYLPYRIFENQTDIDTFYKILNN